MLDPVYAICWLDAIHYKVKDDKVVQSLVQYTMS